MSETWLDRIPRPCQPAGRAIMKQLIETGEFEVTEYRISPFDGERWDCSFDFSPPYRYSNRAFIGFTYEEPSGSLRLNLEAETGCREIAFSKLDLIKKALGLDAVHNNREGKLFREASLQLEQLEDRISAFRASLK